MFIIKGPHSLITRRRIHVLLCSWCVSVLWTIKKIIIFKTRTSFHVIYMHTHTVKVNIISSLSVCGVLQKWWVWNALHPPLKTNRLHSLAGNTEDAVQWIMGDHLSTQTCMAAALLRPPRLKMRSGRERAKSHQGLNLTVGGCIRQTALCRWDSKTPTATCCDPPQLH